MSPQRKRDANRNGNPNRNPDQATNPTAPGAGRQGARARTHIPRPLAAPTYRIVFVCTGNICRSPMAEVITRSLAQATNLGDGTTMAKHLDVRSAGTAPWHEREPMHPLAAEALARAGYPPGHHQARQFTKADLGGFDLIVSLDRRHRQTLRSLGADPDRLVVLRTFDPDAGAAADVPDPYYGDDIVFDQCRDMIVAACHGLVRSLSDEWGTLWPVLES